MKNLVWAIAGFIVLIIVVFVFAAKQKPVSDTTIPSPVSVFTPSPDLTEVDINKKSNDNTNMELKFPLLKKEDISGKKVRIETNKGVIVFELFDDSPIAASNFISLTNKKLYDGLKFHRRVDNFVIQGGDPKGDGTSGPGYSFPDEPVNHDYTRGIVAMANSGPNTNGSQFFIMLADTPLPKQYSVFGKVIEGLDVVDKIVVGDLMQKVSLE